jgi:hypothetical protein
LPFRAGFFHGGAGAEEKFAKDPGASALGFFVSGAVVQVEKIA